MARGFATPIRSPAARCCRPWVQVWQCCPKVLKASDTGRQKARFLSASKAAVRQMWTVADLNGAPRTFSSSPHGSVTRTTRQKSRCCSRFLTARRRKRSVSGANKAERARLRRATWASDSSSRLAIRIFVCLRARSSFAPTAHSLRSCPASRSAPQSAVSDRIHRRPAGPGNGACRARAKRVTGLLAKHGCAMDAAAQKNKLIKGWEVVIGMEIHAQVSSDAKLFSGASTEFGGEANSHVSLVDAAMPGMLPVINAECVRQAVRTGLGLKAQINLKSVFDRKNYFYPDLPQGYQISQYKSPIVGEGEVMVDMPDGTVRVGIERLHLEQDAGKSLHDQHATMSFVDLNRSGVALMEIVSKPDLRSSEEAKAFVTKLRSILRYLGTSDGDMEKGNLRADVNVSVRRPGDPLGTRCEIKNVNSIRFVGMAVDCEARRQIGVIEDGGTIEQETRLYDPGRNETRAMRTKEEAHDYRYFPDPDLQPLELTADYVEGLARGLPELPDQKKARFMSEFGLAGVLVAERESADFFEAVVRRGDGS